MTTLRFGLVPHTDDDETQRVLRVLESAMTAAFAREVRVVSCDSPADLVNAFEAGMLELIWSSPTLALTAPGLRGGTPFATSVRQGVAHYHGVLFVQRESTIRSALQLQGTRAAWADPSSASGYIFPRVTLAGYGFEPATFFGEEAHFGSHGAVVRAVLDEGFDVGATYAIFENGEATRKLLRSGFVDIGRAEEVRVVLSTPPIPADVFLAAESARLTPAEAVDALRRVCVSHAGEFRTIFGADDVIPSDPAALEELRRQLDDARVLGVLS